MDGSYSRFGLAPDLHQPHPDSATHRTPGPCGVISFDQHVAPLAFLGDLIGRHGDVVRYQTPFGPCFLFIHPDHVQTILHRENYRRASLVKMMLGDGLLASDGPRWREQRRLMQPDFLPAAIGPMTSIITRHTQRMCDHWRANGTTVDLTSAMTRLTLRIIVEALFSDDLSDAQESSLCNAVTQTVNELSNISWTIFGAAVRFTPDSHVSFTSAKQTIDAACYDMIARRRAQPAESRPRDLLTKLIEAETDVGPMTDVQLRDEIVTMLVGGHETTALALTWAWKALAEHPHIEAALHTELDQILHGNNPTAEHVAGLSCTSGIFQEAMRLYPPVWYMARVATREDTIAGHFIPRGACVLISAYFTHRHQNFWRDPERFDPSRFTHGAKPTTHRYAYFPFGGGRHQCLGMHFAQIEGTMILAQTARQFRVLPLNAAEIRPNPGITLRQSPATMARIEARSCEQQSKTRVA